MRLYGALSIYQPWAGLIVAGDSRLGAPHHKPAESRWWAAPADAVGEYFALHAARPFDADGAAFLRSIGVCLDDVHPVLARACAAKGAVVGVARLARVVRLRSCAADARLVFSAGLTARAADHAAGAVAAAGDPDPRTGLPRQGYGWVWTDVQALLEPVPWPGEQRIWRVPAALSRAIDAQLGSELDLYAAGQDGAERRAAAAVGEAMRAAAAAAAARRDARSRQLTLL